MTEWLAWYGALLSTALFLWNIQSSKPRIKLDWGAGIDGDEDAAEAGLFLVIVNRSSKDVHLSAISFLVPTGPTGFRAWLRTAVRFRVWPRHVGWVHLVGAMEGIDTGCPCSIPPGKSHVVFVPASTLGLLAQEARKPKARARVQDQAFREKYSRSTGIGEFG